MARRSKKKNKLKKQQKKKTESEIKKYKIYKQMTINTEKKVKIAVYDNLRRNNENKFHKKLENSKFLGICETLPKYSLYDYENFVGVIPNGTTSIVVEIYEIPEKLLNQLDLIYGFNEKNSTNYFIRKFCWTPYGVSKIYFYNHHETNDSKKKLIVSGDYIEYKKLDN